MVVVGILMARVARSETSKFPVYSPYVINPALYGANDRIYSMSWMYLLRRVMYVVYFSEEKYGNLYYELICIVLWCYGGIMCHVDGYVLRGKYSSPLCTP